MLYIWIRVGICLDIKDYSGVIYPQFQIKIPISELQIHKLNKTFFSWLTLLSHSAVCISALALGTSAHATSVQHSVYRTPKQEE